jgi:hypothetical protein
MVAARSIVSEACIRHRGPGAHGNVTRDGLVLNRDLWRFLD